MPSDLVQRVDLDLLYLPFLEAALEILAACRKHGADFYATLGFRTYAEQDALYAQGRTAPGTRVTNARGGQSAHCFGLALDLCRDKDIARPGLQPEWGSAAYAALVEEAERRGLHSGRSYNDWPHIAWPGFETATKLEPLDAEFRRSGVLRLSTRQRLDRVWALLENK